MAKKLQVSGESEWIGFNTTRANIQFDFIM
jgi:hypothetical protein